MALAAGVSAKNANGSGTTVATSAITTAASGSGILVSTIIDSGQTYSTPAITDSKSNIWVQVGTTFTGLFGSLQRIYLCANATGGASHTFTLNASGGTKAILVQEVTTTNGAGVTLDQTNRNNDAATPFTSPGVLTTVANEFLYSPVWSNGSANPDTFTAGASFVMTQNLTDNTFWSGAQGYLVVAATGTYNSSWTTSGSDNTDVWIATVSEAAGGGGGTAALSGSAATGGSGTSVPNFQIPL